MPFAFFTDDLMHKSFKRNIERKGIRIEGH